MLIFEHESSRTSLGLLKQLPTKISAPGTCDNVTEWTMPDGYKRPSSCISCIDQPCMTMNAETLNIPSIEGFSKEPNQDLCPVNAIQWNSDTNQPTIDDAACIGCGLCVQNCPVGAITIRHGAAEVADGANREQVIDIVDDTTANKEIQKRQISHLPAVCRSVPTLSDSDICNLSSSLLKLNDRQSRLVVRAALSNLGASTMLSRNGDVHTRTDGAYSFPDGITGPLEVEFGSDSLEAARAALDDVVVFNSRFSLRPKDQHPLIVVGFMPRERQGYWQVLRDITSVLGIRFHTISIGALLLLSANGKPLNGNFIQQMNPTFNNTSIRHLIEKRLERYVDIEVGFGGILEPEK